GRLPAAHYHTPTFSQTFFIIFPGTAQFILRPFTPYYAGKFLCMLMYRSPEHRIDTLLVIGEALIIFKQGFITLIETLCKAILLEVHTFDLHNQTPSSNMLI